MPKPFMKEVENVGEVFDFEAIANEGFPLNILIAERDERGKTYGQKEFQYSQALKHIGAKRRQCLWLRSLGDDARKEAKKFLIDLPPNMEEDSDRLNSIVEKTGGEIVHEQYGTIFRFSNVSTTRTMKGTRETFREVVWDEFNESTKTFITDLIDNYTNILSSANNTHDKIYLRLWIMGNNKGLNHPLLANLGITYITGEVMKIYAPNGDKLALLIVPMYTETEIKEIKKKKEHDPLFQLNTVLGTADHIYFNKSNLDEVNNIYRYMELGINEVKPLLTKMREGKYLRLSMTMFINGEYLNLYDIPEDITQNENTWHHVLSLNSYQQYMKRLGIKIKIEDMFARDINGEPIIYATKPKDVRENISMALPKWKQYRLEELADMRWSYENEISRMLFLQLIR